MPLFGKSAVSHEEAAEYIALSNRLLMCTDNNRDLAMSMGALFEEKRVQQLKRDEYLRNRTALLENLPRLEEQHHFLTDKKYAKKVSKQLLEIQELGKEYCDNLLFSLDMDKVEEMRKNFTLEHLLSMSPAQRLRVREEVTRLLRESNERSQKLDEIWERNQQR